MFELHSLGIYGYKFGEDHRRLGHASFGYLKKLFPSLFTKSNISSFNCDVCELAKNQNTSFSFKLNKSPILIHSDVWRTSKVSTLGVDHIGL